MNGAEGGPFLKRKEQMGLLYINTKRHEIGSVGPFAVRFSYYMCGSWEYALYLLRFG